MSNENGDKIEQALSFEIPHISSYALGAKTALKN
jgi:hypothetical protein